MANEISIGLTISFNKGGATVTQSESLLVDVTGDTFTHGVQTIGTSQEEIVQGEVGTPGYLLIKNLDSTNYVEIGSTSGVYTIKLLAGDVALYPHNSATIYAKASVELNIAYLLIEL